MAAQYACQITFNLDSQSRMVLLDNVEATSVSLSSTLTTHPTLAGDMIADHMYKDPATLTIRGVYSLNGGTEVKTDSGYSKLAGFQRLFERIKDEGVLCSIVKTSKSLKQGRFLVRDNMVLTRIEWTENINTLAFNLSFTQVLKATIQLENVDLTDTYLPNITGINVLNFTDTLINMDYIDALVLDTYKNSGIITSLQWEKIKKRFNIAGYDTVGHSIYSASSALNYIMGGWAIWNIIDSITSLAESVNMGISTYDYLTEAEQDKLDEELYDNISSIRKSVQAVNNQMNVYQVSANSEQECTCVIDNNYYTFIFKKNNTNGKYTLSVQDMGQRPVGNSLSDVTSAPTDYLDCTAAGALFTGTNGSYVYLLRDENEDASDLTNYYIVSSKIRPEDFSQTLTDLILEGMKNG